ncbi:integrase [Ixodes scapularis]
MPSTEDADRNPKAGTIPSVRAALKFSTPRMVALDGRPLMDSHQSTGVGTTSLNEEPTLLIPAEMQVDPDLVALANAAPITPESRWGTLVSREELRAAQLSDGLCQKVMHQLAEENSADAGNPRDLDSYLLSSDGILLRYIPQADDGSSGPPFRSVIPRKLRKSFIRYMHDPALAGHSSGSKTYEKLSQIATWPGMRQDVMRYARSCPVCQKAKPRGGQPPGLMQSVESKYPWECVACDVVGPFPRSPRGNQYLLVVTDHFTKWVEMFPLRKLDSKKIWDCLLETFARFGFAATLITDNASYFVSKVFVDACKALGIRHKRTSPYHPQANITERVNRNLKQMLVSHTERHKDWDAKLAEMAFATRTTINRSTGFTPAQLNFGKELVFPLGNGLLCTDPASTQRTTTQFAEDLRKRFTENLREARESLDVSRLQQANQYNKGRRNLQFKVGDLVLRRTHPLSDAARGFTASLAKRWDGPYRVSSKLSNLSYELVHCESGEVCGSIHVADLKAFYEPEEVDVSQVPDDDYPDHLSEDSTPSLPRYNLRRR